MVQISELESIFLFAELTEEELAKVAAVLKKKSYSKGDKIFSENEPGGQLHIIQSGEVTITRVIREGQQQNLSNLSQGMYFGIVSLIDGQPHSATATASTDTKLLVLNRDDFYQLARENPACGTKILRGLVHSLCQYMRHINEKFMDMLQYVSLDR
jgi:CRP-like cAMP-binding protein